MRFEATAEPVDRTRLVRVATAAIAAIVLAVTPRASAQEWGRPVWSDEFDGRSGSTPDAAKWTYDVGDLNVNNELEIYCSPASTSSPCDPSVPNAYQDGRGSLMVRAVKTGGGVWTSARLKTQGLEEFQYGRIEARMRLPVGPGLWPAFWMLGSNITTTGWPQCGEIDFMESVPVTAGLGPTTVRATLHGPGYSGAAGLGQDYTFGGGGRVDTAFHVYGAIWSPYMIQFYVDDPRHVFFVRTARDVPGGSPWVYDHAFFVILNLAVGGDWPGPPDASTPSPASMFVDYVRVYHAAAIPGPLVEASAITVKAGGTATSTLSFVSARGAGRMYLACAGAVPQAACSIDPYVVDFSDTAEATATVTVTTRGAAGGVGSMARSGGIGGAGLIFMASILYRPREPRRRRWWIGAGVPLVLAVVAASCGGGGGSPATREPGTPTGSYTLTVTAFTVSGDSSSASIPLTVTP